MRYSSSKAFRLASQKYEMFQPQVGRDSKTDYDVAADDRKVMVVLISNR